jgi:hypothetical protein
MILVVTHYQDRNYYDSTGRITSEKGTYVSHGIDVKTGKTVTLPGEKWRDFRHECIHHEGEWYLK